MTNIDINIETTDALQIQKNLVEEAKMGELLSTYENNISAMASTAPQQVIDMVLNEISNMLCDGGQLEKIEKSMTIAQDSLQLAKKGLEIANSANTIASNIAKLTGKLNSTQDPTIECIPSVKECLDIASASAKSILISKYLEAKQQLLDLYNSMICTGNDSTLDNMVVSVNNILDTISPLLDPLMVEYTNHTIAEARNLCNTGFAYLGMIQRASATQRKTEEQQDNLNNE